MKKRMLSLVAAGLVVYMAAGCNGKKSYVKEVKTYGDYPINTNETLTLWSSLHANVAASATNLGETEFAKELEKETGIKINYIHPAIGKESENFSLMIASGELPDMVQHNWQAAHGGPAGMIEDEVILPLNDLIDKNAPNLKAYLKEHPEVYTKLNETADSFFAELQKIVDESGRGYQVNHICSLGSMFCTTQEVYDYETAKTSDTKAYADYCNYMQNHGIYLAPAQFEAMFISAAHTQEQLSQTLETARSYFKNN